VRHSRGIGRKKGRMKIHIFDANPTSGEALSGILSRLCTALGQTADVTVTDDPSIEPDADLIVAAYLWTEIYPEIVARLASDHTVWMMFPAIWPKGWNRHVEGASIDAPATPAELEQLLGLCANVITGEDWSEDYAPVSGEA